eukprot:ANDGO_02463.mRNA.1 hypothetical protein
MTNKASLVFGLLVLTSAFAVLNAQTAVKVGEPVDVAAGSSFVLTGLSQSALSGVFLDIRIAQTLNPVVANLKFVVANSGGSNANYFNGSAYWSMYSASAKDTSMQCVLSQTTNSSTYAGLTQCVYTGVTVANAVFSIEPNTFAYTVMWELAADRSDKVPTVRQGLLKALIFLGAFTGFAVAVAVFRCLCLPVRRWWRIRKYTKRIDPWDASSKYIVVHWMTSWFKYRKPIVFKRSSIQGAELIAMLQKLDNDSTGLVDGKTRRKIELTDTFAVPESEKSMELYLESTCAKYKLGGKKRKGVWFACWTTILAFSSVFAVPFFKLRRLRERLGAALFLGFVLFFISIPVCVALGFFLDKYVCTYNCCTFNRFRKDISTEVNADKSLSAVIIDKKYYCYDDLTDAKYTCFFGNSGTSGSLSGIVDDICIGYQQTGILVVWCIFYALFIASFYFMYDIYKAYARRLSLRRLASHHLEFGVSNASAVKSPLSSQGSGRSFAGSQGGGIAPSSPTNQPLLGSQSNPYAVPGSPPPAASNSGATAFPSAASDSNSNAGVYVRADPSNRKPLDDAGANWKGTAVSIGNRLKNMTSSMTSPDAAVLSEIQQFLAATDRCTVGLNPANGVAGAVTVPLNNFLAMLVDRSHVPLDFHGQRIMFGEAPPKKTWRNYVPFGKCLFGPNFVNNGAPGVGPGMVLDPEYKQQPANAKFSEDYVIAVVKFARRLFSARGENGEALQINEIARSLAYLALVSLRRPALQIEILTFMCEMLDECRRSHFAYYSAFFSVFSTVQTLAFLHGSSRVANKEALVQDPSGKTCSFTPVNVGLLTACANVLAVFTRYDDPSTSKRRVQYFMQRDGIGILHQMLENSNDHAPIVDAVARTFSNFDLEYDIHVNGIFQSRKWVNKITPQTIALRLIAKRALSERDPKKYRKEMKKKDKEMKKKAKESSPGFMATTMNKIKAFAGGGASGANNKNTQPGSAASTNSANASADASTPIQSEYQQRSLTVYYNNLFDSFVARCAQVLSANPSRPTVEHIADGMAVLVAAYADRNALIREGRIQRLIRNRNESHLFDGIFGIYHQNTDSAVVARAFSRMCSIFVRLNIGSATECAYRNVVQLLLDIINRSKDDLTVDFAIRALWEISKYEAVLFSFMRGREDLVKAVQAVVERRNSQRPRSSSAIPASIFNFKMGGKKEHSLDFSTSKALLSRLTRFILNGTRATSKKSSPDLKGEKVKYKLAARIPL